MNIFKDRFSEIKKASEPLYKSPKSVQETIEIQKISESGIFEVADGKYSKTYRFSDVNYATRSEDEQESFFQRYCRCLNSFDCTFKITVNNKNKDMDVLRNEVMLKYRNDGFDKMRESYNRIIEEKILALLRNPQIAEELAAGKPKAAAPVSKNTDIERRIREIDRQIGKLMELYQQDDIPPELLGEKINRLYGEKTALENSIAPVEETNAMPLDLVAELITNAAEIWDFADENQKRRILQSLISRIVLTDDQVDIEWAF